MAADRLDQVGRPLLLVGAAVRAWAMFDKLRLERQADAPNVWWALVAYWMLVLLGLAGLGAAGLVSGLL